VKLTVGRTGHEVLPGGSLSVVLTPTPRWPDLMCLYDGDQKVMFTSKLFGAHVAPALAGSKVRGRGMLPAVCCDAVRWLQGGSQSCS
jgi:flavorubredoxin